ncbi:transmembrane protein 116 isoform X1 [Cyclopterus lumpus]|uniref:transmembrane protein 116 isoform X1 n=1 Tax=Cyclopterus lumpus TaxID=8103 RepID=UPI00148713DA|nr:transmembrane protein 116 isoform X1 [Cyclopterus lumpus]
MRQSHDESLARVWVWSGSGLVSSLQGGVSMLAEWAKSEWMTQAAQTFILHLSSLNMSTPDTLFTNSSERNTTGAKDWSEVYEAVRCIQLVMALLSVLGSGSIIVCVTSLRLRPSPELQPLFLLSVSDLLLALCWLIGAALFSQHCSRLNTHCYHLHTVEQILYMASFFYTLNYVLNLYTGIRDKFYSCINRVPPQVFSRVSAALLRNTDVHAPGFSLNWRSSAVCSLFPVLLMTPVFIQGNISQCQANFSEPYRCLLMHTGALYLTSQHLQTITTCSRLHIYRIAVFLATFSLTLLSIIVLVVKARRIYRRVVTSNGYLGHQQQASFRVMDRRMLQYPLIFILCWGPAVSLALLRLLMPSTGQGVAGVAFSISQAFTSASQGFLNCLVYGWTRGGLRGAGRRVLSQDKDTQTPLLRLQKKTSYQTLRTS